MNVARQDAWSEDEDLMLAEIVLRHIREGSTQLAAFEEVGRKLSRTAAACGFRWNSSVRKQYETAISLAKDQRRSFRKGRSEVAVQTEPVLESEQQAPRIQLTDIIAYLEELQTSLMQEKAALEEINDLKDSVTSLEIERDKWKDKYFLLEQDYQAMLSIMEKARKLTILQEEEKESLRFQMDSNGNLERVHKK